MGGRVKGGETLSCLRRPGAWNAPRATQMDDWQVSEEFNRQLDAHLVAEHEHYTSEQRRLRTSDINLSRPKKN